MPKQLNLFPLNKYNLSSKQAYCILFFLLIFFMLTSNSSFQNSLEPSLQKPVYLISPNFQQQHLQVLLHLFSLHSIPVYLQESTKTFFKNNERNFVVVDNKEGIVTLGPQFSSLLMFVVGYPNKGPNKKNHYCKTAEEVYQKYNYFCTLSEYNKEFYRCSTIKMKSRSLLNSSLFTQFESKEKIPIKSTSKFEEVSEEGRSCSIIGTQKKLFLYLKSSNKILRKYIFRIAACNPVKFIVVEDLEDLDLSLSVLRTKNNFVFVQFQHLEEVLSLDGQEFSILLFCSKKEYLTQNIIQNKRIRFVVSCYQEIIRHIRKAGFHIVSVKDLQKSIVRYDNPFTNQTGQKSVKKLNWIETETKVKNKENSSFFEQKQNTEGKKPRKIIKIKRNKDVKKVNEEYLLNQVNSARKKLSSLEEEISKEKGENRRKKISLGFPKVAVKLGRKPQRQSISPVKCRFTAKLKKEVTPIQTNASNKTVIIIQMDGIDIFNDEISQHFLSKRYKIQNLHQLRQYFVQFQDQAFLFLIFIHEKEIQDFYPLFEDIAFVEGKFLIILVGNERFSENTDEFVRKLQEKKGGLKNSIFPFTKNPYYMSTEQIIRLIKCRIN